MATFTVDFLGCKVSQTDVQEIRERLVADGHVESGDAADMAVVNTCCVTHEAVRKSRQAARRAARTAGRVYVTGCGANLAGDALRRACRRTSRSCACRGSARPSSWRATSARSAAFGPTSASTGFGRS